jgi:hypothetical protein
LPRAATRLFAARGGRLNPSQANLDREVDGAMFSLAIFEVKRARPGSVASLLHSGWNFMTPLTSHSTIHGLAS